MSVLWHASAPGCKFADDDVGGGDPKFGQLEKDGDRRKSAQTQLTKEVLRCMGDAPLPLDCARASVFPDMSSFPPWVEDGSAGGGGGGAGDEVEVVDAKRGDEKLLPLPETSRK